MKSKESCWLFAGQSLSRTWKTIKWATKIRPWNHWQRSLKLVTRPTRLSLNTMLRPVNLFTSEQRFSMRQSKTMWTTRLRSLRWTVWRSWVTSWALSYHKQLKEQRKHPRWFRQMANFLGLRIMKACQERTQCLLFTSEWTTLLCLIWAKGRQCTHQSKHSTKNSTSISKLMWWLLRLKLCFYRCKPRTDF